MQKLDIQLPKHWIFANVGNHFEIQFRIEAAINEKKGAKNAANKLIGLFIICLIITFELWRKNN